MDIKVFEEAKRFNSRQEQLRFAVDMSLIDGYNLEFGVARGITITLIANKRLSTIIWGFYSFEGLPERWDQG